MTEDLKLSRAQISRAALQRLSLAMRHLFTRGSYKPLGVSGESMISSMLALNPEIYGSMGDEEKVELNGLLYIFQRLPQGIEQCRYIKLISREGLEETNFEPLIPSKRRRNCYRIDEEQMYIEMTRGRSDIYDVLTHLTFMYIEAEKIRRNSLDPKNRKRRSWKMLRELVQDLRAGKEINQEVGYTYLSAILGRSFKETADAADKFSKAKDVNSLLEIIYELGRLSMKEFFDKVDREISFSSPLRAKLGHHIFGEEWATQIKDTLWTHSLFKKDLHVISANLHSVMNSLYAKQALKSKQKNKSLEELAGMLSESKVLRQKVRDFALSNGMYEIHNPSGTNISVQVIDCSKIKPEHLTPELGIGIEKNKLQDTVLIVMDYAFGEQAYETMDELLKPYEFEGKKHKLDICSINIMGKAGILQGGKSDLMIPSSHIFEGSADNYPFDNEFSAKDFEGYGLGVYEGSMITVLGTSLQNRDILRYFLKSSWKAVGLEMEGAHYQKAIQAAALIRNNIKRSVKLRYAYYASDNPLETGGTLASGSLGLDGVKPTYLITSKMLEQILQ
ncbi:DUF6909 family protein [Portibacter lacus]|uniref:Uncharacterized protein n=1 Tax=Portibacter lacus TaxID=1099794 RepID=A0AA37SKT0_9BACT|nr:hypothetical protein [Portibacter lacus]GLR15662.1 hypothetical protein GCM10007940_02770 [Portibacter lacus]